MPQPVGTPLRRLGRLLPAALLLLLLVPSVSSAANRTWVSGVGDDANPCIRWAPCKTFAGAISKTNAGGEINVLDNGAYGTVTITKSITIDGNGFQVGMLASGAVTGVTVNSATARVVMRDLELNGGGSTRGAHGIRVLAARSVTLVRSRIANFAQNGIWFQPSVKRARLNVRDSEIVNNGGAGVFASPTGAGPARVTLRRNEIEGNACGIVASSYGLSAAPVDYTDNCGAATSGGTDGRATINAFRNGISENDDAGVLATGPKAGVRLGRNEISGNGRGLAFNGAGTLESFGDNFNIGNVTDGAPTSTNPRL